LLLLFAGAQPVAAEAPSFVRAGVQNGVALYGVNGVNTPAYIQAARPSYAPALYAPACVPLPEVMVSKTAQLALDADHNGVVSPGDTLSYTIHIWNLGCVSATGGVFTDTPGLYTHLVVGSVQTNLGVVVSGNTPGDRWVTVQGSAINAASSGRAPANLITDATITFAVTIDNPLPAGVTYVSNQGAVIIDGQPPILSDDPSTEQPNDATVTSVVAGAGFFATKTGHLLSDNDHNGVVSRGDTLQYTVQITNEGNMDAADVVYTDMPDANTRLVNGSVTATQGTIVQGNASGDTSVRIHLGTLPGMNGSATIVYNVTILPSMPLSETQVRNQGFISNTNVPTTTPTTGPDGGPTIIVVENPGMLAAHKTGALYIGHDTGVPQNILPGDTLMYTITIWNTGGEVVTDVVFLDTPDVDTHLITGSVTTSQGSVVAGNTAGDTAVRVNVGDVQPGASSTVTITYLATIADPFPFGVKDRITNLGVVSSTQVLTVTDGNTPNQIIIPAPIPGNIRLGASMPNCAIPGQAVDVTWVITNATVQTYTGGALNTTVGGPGSSALQIPVGQIRGQSTYSVVQSIIVSQPVAYGDETITATAQIQGGGFLGSTSRSVAVHVCAPDLRTSSATILSSKIFAAEGLTYTWILRNTGDGNAVNATALFTPAVLPLYNFVDIVTTTNGMATWDPIAQHVVWQGNLPAGSETTIVFFTQSQFGLPRVDLASHFEAAHASRPTFYGSVLYPYPYKLFFMLVLRDATPAVR
jgi:uncharacterized repeat protein (TIGR01451 family)